MYYYYGYAICLDRGFSEYQSEAHHMIRTWNPESLAPPFGTYSHCCVIHEDCELLAIAGQIGAQSDGSIVEGIEAQCEQVFENLLAALSANGMDWDNLIKLGIFLTDRSFVPVYREVRARMLGDVAPPGTLVVVSGLADERWLVEVDAYAAKKHFAHQRR